MFILKPTRFFPRVLVPMAAILMGGWTVLAQNPGPAAAAVPNAATEDPKARVAVASVTILEDTPIKVLTVGPLSTKRTKEGDPLLFIVGEDVFVGDVLEIPRGAAVHGTAIGARKSGVLTGSPEMTLKLTSLDLGGRSYPLYTHQFRVRGTSKTKPTETKALDGAYVGAIVGSVFSGVSAKNGLVYTDDSNRAASMAAGAAIGAGVGTAVSAASPGPGIWIPSEAEVDFSLAAPVTVVPVTAKEAERLGLGLHHGGPYLYVRGDTP
jgi:hypothetical protein